MSYTNIVRPNRGNMLLLWEMLEPNEGYTFEGIQEIAKELELPEATARNLVNASNRGRDYLLLDELSEKYFRSDSNVFTRKSILSEVDKPLPANLDNAAIASKITSYYRELEILQEKRRSVLADIEAKKDEAIKCERRITEIQQLLAPLGPFIKSIA